MTATPLTCRACGTPLIVDSRAHAACHNAACPLRGLAFRPLPRER